MDLKDHSFRLSAPPFAQVLWRGGDASPVWILIISLFLSGCASTSQDVPVAAGLGEGPKDPSHARVYVMRPKSMNGSGTSWMVQDGTNLIGNLGVGSHLTWERPPGRVQLHATLGGIFAPNSRPVEFNAEPARTYFVRYTMGFKIKGALLTEADGRKELQRCAQTPQRRIEHDPTLVNPNL